MTDEELKEISYKTCLDCIRALFDKNTFPEFPDMPPLSQLKVLKTFVDTALGMDTEDIKDCLSDDVKELLNK
jgi:hypothetical protein